MWCVLLLWIHAVPKRRDYRNRHETVVLAGGEVTHRLTKVDVEQLEAWDARHNAGGDEIVQGANVSDGSNSDIVEPSIKPKETA